LDIGRVKATVPSVLDTEEPLGAAGVPLRRRSEQGSFFVPDQNANVWIEFEGGDLSYPIWSGTFFSSGDRPGIRAAGTKSSQDQERHKIILDDDANTLE